MKEDVPPSSDFCLSYYQSQLQLPLAFLPLKLPKYLLPLGLVLYRGRFVLKALKENDLPCLQGFSRPPKF